MTREEQIDWLCRLRSDLNNGIIFTPWNKEFTEALTDVLDNKGERAGGLVSKQVVLDALDNIKYSNEFCEEHNIDWSINLGMAHIVVNELGTTNPPAKNKGKWIDVTNGRGGHKCSICNDYAPSYQSGDEWLSKFCPNCGADMRKSVKEKIRCNTCRNSDDELSGECYECIKGIFDHYEPEEVKAESAELFNGLE